MAHTIRTTMRPDVEITVSDAEYESLLEMGLVYDGSPPIEAADPFDLRVAQRLADPDSATRVAIDGLVEDAATGLQDPAVAGFIADDDSATAVALRAAFVAGGVLNSDGSPNTTKKLMARLTADGTDIDDLFIVSA